MHNSFKALILTALVLFHSALFAQDATEEGPDNDPHRALALAYSSQEVARLRFEQDMRISFSSGLKQIPEMAQLEAECPGFIIGMGKAMRPVMYQGHLEDNAWFQQRLEVLFRKRLTQEDAAQAAAFWGSDTGQGLLATTIASASADNTFGELAEMGDEDRPISQEAFMADQMVTAARTVERLSEAQKAQLEAELAAAPWFPRFMAIVSEIQALSLEMLNRDYSPELDAKMALVADSFTASHFNACNAGK